MDLLSQYKGTYQLSTKWGGATGVWNAYKVLTVSASGQVYVDTTQLPASNVSSSATPSGGTQFRVVFPDGSVAQLNFVQNGTVGYYFDAPFQGTGLTGAIQPNNPASGGLDLRGVPAKAIIPPTTADLLVQYQGAYQLATKWGGASGTWTTSKVLSISSSGDVYVDNTLIAPAKLSSTTNAAGNPQFRVVFPDNSVAQINFALNGAPGYYFDTAVQGWCLTGVFQPNDPASGALDLRGVPTNSIVTPTPTPPTPPNPTPPSPTPNPTPNPTPSPAQPNPTPYVSSGGPAGVSVRLLSSTGAGLAGANVNYRTSLTASLGTTGADGMVTGNLPAGSYTFIVEYAGQVNSFGPVTVASGNVVVFQTVAVDLQIAGGAEKHAGANFSYRGSTGYLTAGGTTSASGLCRVQLLPGKYSFVAVYREQSNQQEVSVSGPTKVIFTVVSTTIKLTGGAASKAGANVTYRGSSGYSANAGKTGADGTLSLDLLPGTYKFALGFNEQVNEQSASVASPSAQVEFQLVPTTVKLSGGSGSRKGATLSYTGNTGYMADGGTTGDDGALNLYLLPGNFTFNLIYQGQAYKQTAVAIAAPAATVTFQVPQT